MSLTLPTVGTVASGGTAGPTWATLLKQALETIDSHDHTSGKGTKVPISGINFNADVDFEGYSLEAIERLGLATQTVSLASAANKNSLYVKDGELYYITTAGADIQVTSGAGLNLSSIGTIGGDFGTADATVTYSDSSKSFLFKQDADQTADIACGSVFIYENVASGKYSKFAAPTGQASNLTYTLPGALPSSVTLPMVSTTAGVLSFAEVSNSMIRDSSGLSVIGRSADSTGDVADITAGTDHHVLRRSGSTLGFGQIATAGITDSAVTTAKINDGAVTQAKRASLGQQISSSCGSSWSNNSSTKTDITNLSVSITTTGRPVFVGLISDGSGSSSAIRLQSNGGIITGALGFFRGVTNISEFSLSETVGSSSDPSASARHPPSSFFCIEAVSAGTYTYKASGGGGVNFNTTTIYADNIKLIAFEL
jgi:hypothetical protein